MHGVVVPSGKTEVKVESVIKPTINLYDILTYEKFSTYVKSVEKQLTYRMTDTMNEIVEQEKQTMAERMAEDAKPKEPTLREVKEWLRVYFTVRRPVVVNCGHKIDNESIPKRNCSECWNAWFNAHGELVQQVEQAYQEHGVDFVTNQHGTKFVKNFLKLMAAVAEFTSKMTEINGSRDKGTIGQETEVQGTGSSQENTQQAT